MTGRPSARSTHGPRSASPMPTTSSRLELPARLRLQLRRASCARSSHSFKRLGIDRIDGALDPRPGHPLGAGHRRRLSRARQAARAGRRVVHRRRHEPGRDAGPLRPGGRLRRLHVRRSLHAARPDRPRRAASRVCQEKGIAIVIAGVMNSGLLANPTPDSHFNYGPAPPGVDRQGAGHQGRLRAPRGPAAGRGAAVPVCPPGGQLRGRRRAHDRAPRRHASANLAFPIPDALWEELRAEGLLREDAPTPVAGARLSAGA